jgi:hypothetical protein
MGRINDTLYAEYLLERLGGKIIESEYGFIAYSFYNNECRLLDTHVAVAHRRTGRFMELYREFVKAAEAHGSEYMTATVHKNDKNHGQTLLMAFAHGWVVATAQDDVITICKKVGV